MNNHGRMLAQDARSVEFGITMYSMGPTRTTELKQFTNELGSLQHEENFKSAGTGGRKASPLPSVDILDPCRDDGQETENYYLLYGLHRGYIGIIIIGEPGDRPCSNTRARLSVCTSPMPPNSPSQSETLFGIPPVYVYIYMCVCTRMCTC